MNESELRAALRDGEGDGPDPDAAVLSGRARASARRTRIAAMSGAVAGVVAAASTGAILLARHGDDHHTTADPPATVTAGAGKLPVGPPSAVPIAPNPTGTASGTASRSQGYGALDDLCPKSFVTSAPAPGSSADATGPLLPTSTTSVLVCGYGSAGVDRLAPAGGTAPGTATLTGAQARALVTSLNSAATTRPTAMCPDYRVADVHRYAFIAIDGGSSTPVVVTLGNPTCSVVITNGTAVRYGWSPPAALSATLQTAQPH